LVTVFVFVVGDGVLGVVKFCHAGIFDVENDGKYVVVGGLGIRVEKPFVTTGI
jgi:hypothetical protein